MNSISKELDDICDEPGLSFKRLDKLKDESKDKYEKFVKLDNDNKEIFRLARAFEGTERNYGIHAGGILITPTAINDTFPTRIVDGRKVTVWDKNEVEEAGGVKIDLLGLQTVSVIQLTLDNILKTTGVEITLEQLYNDESIRNDEETFKMICNKETEAVFQIESDLFKGIISDMQPDNINDIIALTSLGRPRPIRSRYAYLI